jgi:Ca2+-binding RTX toxin-like protein
MIAAILATLVGAIAIGSMVDSSNQSDDELLPMGDTPDEPDAPVPPEFPLGTAGEDQISVEDGGSFDALGGDDTLDVGDNASVRGGSGNDSIKADDGGRSYGGDGDDTISGGDEATIYGEAGNDRLSGFSRSELSGGEGDDTIRGDESLLYGGAGNEVLSISSGRASGGDGNDTLFGADGSRLSGGAGDDVLTSAPADGGTYSTDAFGGEGNDRILAYSGKADGGAGEDTLFASVAKNFADEIGRITLTGGDGVDRFGFKPSIYPDEQSVSNSYDAPPPSDDPADTSDAEPADTADEDYERNIIQTVTITDFDPQTEQLVIEEEEHITLSEIEIEPAEDGSHTDVIAHYLFNSPAGWARSDEPLSFLIRLEGVPTLSDDQIVINGYPEGTPLTLEVGTDENDVLVADGGEAVVTRAGDDQVTSDSDNAIVRLGDGNDSLVASGENINVDGGAGNDVLTLPGDTSYAYGGNGDDTIVARAGDVSADGGYGDDSFVAERGSGTNSFAGGPGFDSYVIGPGDTIADFGDGQYTLNVYPEDLAQGPALLDGPYLSNSKVVLNLPPEVTGDLSLTATQVDALRSPYQLITISTQSGQDLLEVRTAPQLEASIDLFTINRDVVFQSVSGFT